MVHSHSDSEDISRSDRFSNVQKAANSLSNSVGELNLIQSSSEYNQNRSNNAHRISLGEIIFGSSTTSSNQTLNQFSTTLY